MATSLDEEQKFQLFQLFSLSMKKVLILSSLETELGMPSSEDPHIHFINVEQ